MGAFVKAVAFAADKHRNQRRKDADASPYINHPIALANEDGVDDATVLRACPATEDFFRARLDQMIDLRHSLAVLSSRMPWQQIEASVAHLFSRKAHAGVAMPDLDLFGEAPAPLARKSNAGRPRVPLRTMTALLYLKHAFDLSDEAVVQGWSENPYWQHFSGQALL